MLEILTPYLRFCCRCCYSACAGAPDTGARRLLRGSSVNKVAQSTSEAAPVGAQALVAGAQPDVRSSALKAGADFLKLSTVDDQPRELLLLNTALQLHYCCPRLASGSKHYMNAGCDCVALLPLALRIVWGAIRLVKSAKQTRCVLNVNAFCCH